MDNDLFTPSPETDGSPKIDENKDYYSELVGEGKKFKDNHGLARGKAEADALVTSLLRQVDELRSDLNQRMTVEDLMTRINDIKNTPASNQGTPNPDERGEDNKQQLTPEQLEELLENKLSQREQAKRAQENADIVKQALVQTLGANFQEELQKRADELGLSKEEINRQAQVAPKALLRALGLNEQRKDGGPDLFAPPRSNVDTQKVGLHLNGQEKTMKYYQQMRVNDPKKYHSKEIQLEMHREAQKLGERFFNS